MAKRRKLTIRIRRKGFRVRPTTYIRKGKRIRRKGYIVKPTTYIRRAKGICPYCGAPVFARGVKRKGRWYHKECAYVVFYRVPRR
jgi:ribosomal protein S27AE